MKPAFWVILGLGAAIAVGAESSAAADTTRKSYAALFADLLRNLPPEYRAQVDSASVPRPALTEASGPEAKKAPSAVPEERGPELETLPPDVRERVERAVSAAEERKKRALEFKELKK